MSVIFIGDREVGKTTLAVELAKPGGENSFVEVIEPSYEQLKQALGMGIKSQDNNFFKAERTSRRGIKEFKVRVKLPAGNRMLTVKWVDTPGEFWSLNQLSGQYDNSQEWQQLLTDLKTIKGIMLILAPHRNRLKEERLLKARELISKDHPKFLDYDSWMQKFDTWLDFLSTHIGIEQHILICLNMADLFCDYQVEANKLRYALSGQNTMGWQERHEHVLNNYFREIKESINRYNRKTNGNLIQTFITTQENRILLELPWLYLGSRLKDYKL